MTLTLTSQAAATAGVELSDPQLRNVQHISESVMATEPAGPSHAAAVAAAGCAQPAAGPPCACRGALALPPLHLLSPLVNFI